MNVKLLRKIQKHILEEPCRFAMMTWIQRKGGSDDKAMHDDGKQRAFPKCGTTACIAGWAIALSGDGVKPLNQSNSSFASHLLGINGNSLFYLGQWPEKFNDAYDECKTLAGRAKIAAKRIDHFIKTEGRE